ncbi:MAG: DUF4376 domain-containing protein [Thalassospira sp.]|jgi:hypothetical protein|uniref:DUF4376 domain-containing protein n=1 Tax=Thalassospira sp. 11-3 TaxID=2135614 RepID=UPI000D76C8DF|nr:DUF4376 domain-containing protein [Thalassospira sp. 11-3]MBL4839931.1 DUF4376 domain-containing protein [Thalassospira sp.]PXX30874.1 uncharacterized protein DUF4376 [Thalassospira sp. 11-3]
MNTPKYAIFNDDWSLNRTETGTSFTAVTGRPFTDATKHSVETLLEHFVKPITQTPKPSSEWQDVGNQPSVMLEGEGAEQTAKLEWPTSPISLDQAKAKLERKVKEHKFRRMSGGIEFDVNGSIYVVQTDELSLALLDRIAEQAKANLLQNGQIVRMADNSSPLLSQQQIIDLNLAVCAMLCACTDAQTEREYAIDALPDDLQAHMDFDVTAGFPAFPATVTE